MSDRPRARFARRTWMCGAALAAVSAGALLLAGVAPASAADAKKSPSFDFGDWSSYLGSGSSSQFSSLTQINKSNVGQLQVAWTWNAGDGPAPEFGPLVANGKMYVLGSDAPQAAPAAAAGGAPPEAGGGRRAGGGMQRNSVVALDPATGKELWRHRNTHTSLPVRVS